MYSAPYGYQHGPGQPFNAAPQGQNPQMQPGPGPNQPQQMMYNPQQFPMGASGSFPGAPSMMSGPAGPAGMMQTTGMQPMQQMAPNGPMGFQPPFTSSPYGPGIPSTTAPPGQYPPNYMMTGSMGGFPAHAANMAAQQQMIMQQRMPPPQQNPGMGVSTPQRQFSGPQSSPSTSAPNQPGSFPAPQNPQGSPQSQTPTSAQQTVVSVTTPQTPTFPAPGQGTAVNGSSTPVSPGTDSKEREKFALLLEINQELLYELIHLKNTRDEIRKEHEAENSAGRTSPERQREMLEEERAFAEDWQQIIRRFQANLSYLASLADRRGNPPAPGPAYLSPPPLNLKLKFRPMLPAPDATEKVDPSADREDRDRVIKELYRKLQVLFPHLDPRRVPTFKQPGVQMNHGPGAAQQNAMRAAGSLTAGLTMPNSVSSPGSAQRTPQMATAPAPPTTMSAISS